MIEVRQMIVSFRCRLEAVGDWMMFNSYRPTLVVVKKINDNGSEATMEVSGSPEAVVEIANVAGASEVQMYDLKAKFF